MQAPCTRANVYNIVQHNKAPTIWPGLKTSFDINTELCYYNYIFSRVPRGRVDRNNVNAKVMAYVNAKADDNAHESEKKPWPQRLGLLFSGAKMTKREQILKSYRVTKGINQTARECGCSHEVVRRTLITEGLYTSPRIERIRELAAIGMPVAGIAEKLGVSQQCVLSNSPYPRGNRADWPETVNARNIRRCRARKKEKEQA